MCCTSDRERSKVSAKGAPLTTMGISNNNCIAEEQEAEVEEERLRKEREARERRDVLTLGQTREKIQALEIRHQELHEKKQELFLTLKKLLNEDENRKKQQKESSEMYAMHNLVPHPGSFMPPRPMQQQGGLSGRFKNASD